MTLERISRSITTKVAYPVQEMNRLAQFILQSSEQASKLYLLN
jgi:hypothetical protein